MKRYTTIITLLLAATCSYAQVKKGDRLFNRWAYYDAARCYKKKADKESTPELNYKLGQCYQKMLQYNEAKLYYDKVNASGRYPDPMFYYHYGQVLKNTGNYEQALQAFTTYEEMNPGDARGNFYKTSCQVILDEAGTDLPVTVKNANGVNGEHASFSPVRYKEGILFTSSEKNGKSKRYDWNNQPYYDLYYAPNANDLSTFQEEKGFDNLINTKYSDGPASFSKNYDTIYFNRIGKELRGQEKKTINVETNQIFYASLQDGDWKDVTPFPYNSKEYSVASPFITPDGSRIYFSSDMPGGYGNADIYYCDKTGNTWSAPVNMGPAINTFGDEKFPSLDSAGNFYFASDGYQGYGSLDVIVARNNNGTFENGRVLKAPLNSPGDDYGITFIDGKSGYISSVRKESNGDADIFYFNTGEVPCIEDVADYVIGFRCPEEPQTAEEIDTLDLDDIGLMKLIDLSIYFDFDKSNIRPDARITLDSVLNYMKENPNVEAQLNGYCDSRGTNAYNIALGNRRAASAKRYLVQNGINGNRLRTFSYGEDVLSNRCSDGVDCSEAEHQQNRKVHFVFGRTVQPDTSMEETNPGQEPE